MDKTNLPDNESVSIEFRGPDEYEAYQAAPQCLREMIFRMAKDARAVREAVPGWQPIETAPTDETILLHGWDFGDPARGRHVIIGSNYEGRWVDRGMDDPNRDCGNTLQFITCWMPIPAAPTQENGS